MKIKRLMHFLCAIAILSCHSPLSRKPSTGAVALAGDVVQDLTFLDSRYGAKMEWPAGGPKVGEYASFTIKFWDKEKSRAEGPFSLPPKYTEPHIFIWMPESDMDHGSSPIEVKKVAEGVFEVSKIYFSMTGEWDIYIQPVKMKEIFDSRKVSINIQ